MVKAAETVTIENRNLVRNRSAPMVGTPRYGSDTVRSTRSDCCGQSLSVELNQHLMPLHSVSPRTSLTHGTNL